MRFYVILSRQQKHFIERKVICELSSLSALVSILREVASDEYGPRWARVIVLSIYGGQRPEIFRCLLPKTPVILNPEHYSLNTTTGDTYTTISFSYRLGGCTVSNIVTQLCEQIWKILQPEYIPVLSTKSWLEIADAFQTIWGFPNCLGSINGKHIVIKSPPSSGSLFYCYKKRFLTVLLAIVDPHYKFIVYYSRSTLHT
ncbi:hypothetical protein K1T71_014423 [Dendrolimus kikuchii]|uniref:Uncharacterized protein n=1 Tax=Dendrolimus kikuchii TaxID=765133 RepID=A0ACC1CE24_9NEOP|nr:hypothetical protein K1T71_014423 [Dendrolimus kikuchii]